jgi:site-specific recombinase XerD
MSELLNTLQQYGNVDTDAVLQRMTTFRIGGKADYVVYPKNMIALAEVIQLLKKENIPFKVLGKGSKERIIYLNNAAQKALIDYLRVRLDPKYIRTSSNALFISARETRISNKTVQWMVQKYLRMAGFAAKGLSVHKLRHTAATLMYQSGKVDIRVLKDILGHEQLNTTQIYTHVGDKNMEEAVSHNPLSDVVLKMK